MKNIRKIKINHYKLQQSEDGNFTEDSTIALIKSNTTSDERIELANAFTNNNFKKYPRFYRIIGPTRTPHILYFD